MRQQQADTKSQQDLADAARIKTDDLESRIDLVFGVPRTPWPITSTTVTAKFGEVLILDSNVAATVFLPRVTRADIGRWVMVKRWNTGVQTTTVRPGDPQNETIDGSATRTLGTNYAADIFMYAGDDKWITMHPGVS